MDDKPLRFDIPSKPKLIDTCRAFRNYLESVAAAQGRKLGTLWYEDSPEQMPEMYKDQPAVLAAIKQNQRDEASQADLPKST